ncbi:tRNA glutamyl-Q(34) synthetase GluQRS [Spiribacter vilamensis]|nr:tRNA glutamyl-Q(34) synthetase GluQRS [Spiribacter vilamensis]TVO62139.1 tRNA glutamyl-Q(34) synthetase GluQRS [Spiribacter vilamensis]
MEDTPVIGRFAPSPTGPLHQGSLIAAVASYLDARSADGQWRLRIDDVDRGRSRAAAASAILTTLEAFGLEWDGPVQYQDDRRERYQAALEHLEAAGQAYPCGCSRREIAAAAHYGPAGMIYPGTCRSGIPAGKTARSWRFRVPTGTLAFTDRLAGEQSIDPAEAIGDFVIRRGDGLHAYHLAMVLDDADLGVTDVVRGGDLLTATFPQILLQDALGLPRPRYLHLPVALDEAGSKLSKTNGAPPVRPDEASRSLGDALTFLGHPPPTFLSGAPVAGLLDWAVQQWRPSAIPAP